MPTPTLTIEDIAAAHRVRIGLLLYLRGKPEFPRPVERGREPRWDREEVALYFRNAHWSARC